MESKELTPSLLSVAKSVIHAVWRTDSPESTGGLRAPAHCILDPEDVPDKKGAQLIHYYGAYSNAHRGKRAKSAASDTGSLPDLRQVPESEAEWVTLRRKSWAALIRLIYEADPLLCPKCRGQMKIIAVIQDGKVIDKILAHLQWTGMLFSSAVAQ